MNSERFSHSHQIGQRLRSHFPHDMPSMELHGNLGKSELGCYLFVHEAGRNQSQNLVAGVRNQEALANARLSCRFRAACDPFNRHRYGVHVLTQTVWRKIDCPALHGPDAHRNVAKAGHEE